MQSHLESTRRHPHWNLAKLRMPASVPRCCPSVMYPDLADAHPSPPFSQLSLLLAAHSSSCCTAQCLSLPSAFKRQCTEERLLTPLALHALCYTAHCLQVHSATHLFWRQMFRRRSRNGQHEYLASSLKGWNGSSMRNSRMLRGSVLNLRVVTGDI